MKNIYSLFASPHKQIAVLVDPDKHNTNSLEALCSHIAKSKANYVFVGGSVLRENNFEHTVSVLKKNLELPVVIFPGSAIQLSSEADAILFISLLSGRNPEYLIGQQVKAAMNVKTLNLEVIPTAYLLVDGGRTSSTATVTETSPLPANEPDLIAATALAGEMLGMKAVYLEAGSGALNPIRQTTIALVKKTIQIPLIVGGGIRSLKQIEEAFEAGANIVVIGNAIEENPELLLSIA